MISLSWRPAWSTKEVLGHQGYMLRPFLKNKTKEQQQKPLYANVPIFKKISFKLSYIDFL